MAVCGVVVVVVWCGVIISLLRRSASRESSTDIINDTHLRAEEVQQPLAQPPGRVHTIVLLV